MKYLCQLVLWSIRTSPRIEPPVGLLTSALRHQQSQSPELSLCVFTLKSLKLATQFADADTYVARLDDDLKSESLRNFSFFRTKVIVRCISSV